MKSLVQSKRAEREKLNGKRPGVLTTVVVFSKQRPTSEYYTDNGSFKEINGIGLSQEIRRQGTWS